MICTLSVLSLAAQVQVTADEAAQLAEAVVIYFSLTTASGDRKLMRRATNAVATLWGSDLAVAAFIKVGNNQQNFFVL